MGDGGGGKERGDVVEVLSDGTLGWLEVFAYGVCLCIT